jgi:hypothetical protein
MKKMQTLKRPYFFISIMVLFLLTCQNQTSASQVDASKYGLNATDATIALHAKTAAVISRKLSVSQISDLQSDITNPLLPPSATNQAATNVQAVSATLNGTVNANNLSTTVIFEWGLTTNYGNEALVVKSPITGTSDVTVSAAVTGLQLATTYHYRLKAINAVNITYSSDMSFTSKAFEGGITYEISNTIFPNPERGFMHEFSVFSEGASLNLPQLELLRGQNVSLISRVFYLDKFKDKSISAAELLLIQTDLDKIREAGLKGILRFAYTNNINIADAPLTIVKQHLDQLKPVFEQNKDIIAFVQAGFIGAWGEWHSSSNGLATVDNERKVLYKLLSVLPTEIMVQVRTPGQKQQIFNTTLPVSKEIAYSSEKRSRVGHHNDCFMASVNDYGTYNNVQADKLYISNEGLFVPTGGETCPPVPANNAPGCSEATSTMKLLRWTYLNLDWYKPTIAAWKASGCFEELQRNLGYRLALETANFPDQVAINQEFKINIKIANTGYAPLYNYKITSLVFENKASGEIHEIKLPVDLRECKPSGEFIIDKMVKLTDIPAGGYDLYLKISDNSENLKNRSEYSIRLANTNTWDEYSGMNNLKHYLKINAK